MTDYKISVIAPKPETLPPAAPTIDQVTAPDQDSGIKGREARPMTKEELAQFRAKRKADEEEFTRRWEAKHGRSRTLQRSLYFMGLGGKPKTQAEGGHPGLSSGMRLAPILAVFVAIAVILIRNP